MPDPGLLLLRRHDAQVVPPSAQQFINQRRQPGRMQPVVIRQQNLFHHAGYHKGIMTAGKSRIKRR